MIDVSKRTNEIRWKMLAALSELYFLYSDVPKIAKEYDNRTVNHFIDDLNILRHELDIVLTLIDRIDERMKRNEE